MLSVDTTNKYKAVRIHITTYKKKVIQTLKTDKAMDERYRSQNQNNRFVCSICLNTKHNDTLIDEKYVDCHRRKSQSCPVCDKSDIGEANRSNVNERVGKLTKADKIQVDNFKTVQTSNEDVTQNIDLLNEVLLVFQNKKQLDTHPKRTKTVMYKDASVATESVGNFFAYKPKLALSKMFKVSINNDCNGNANGTNGVFTIVNCQPETTIGSQKSIALIKHKSSSIPQMKIDEIKHTIKERARPKDVVKEMHRMFATVHKTNKAWDGVNRPVTRSGPRVLPVVKTLPVKKNSDGNVTDNSETRNLYGDTYKMSSGDAATGDEVGYHRQNKEIKHAYTLCAECQHRKKVKPQIVCECCHKIENV